MLQCRLEMTEDGAGPSWLPCVPDSRRSRLSEINHSSTITAAAGRQYPSSSITVRPPILPRYFPRNSIASPPRPYRPALDPESRP